MVWPFGPSDEQLGYAADCFQRSNHVKVVANEQGLGEVTGCAVKAAAMVGAFAPMLWRRQKQFAARGLAGLQPRLASGGRRSPFFKVRFPVVAMREIERLIVATGNSAWLGCNLPADRFFRHWLPGILRKRIAGSEAQTQLAASPDFPPGE